MVGGRLNLGASRGVYRMSVDSMGTTMSSDGLLNSRVTMCCYRKRVMEMTAPNTFKDRRRVIDGSIVRSLRSLNGSGGVGTMMLHVGSNNNSTCTSRRV